MDRDERMPDVASYFIHLPELPVAEWDWALIKVEVVSPKKYCCHRKDTPVMIHCRRKRYQL